MGSLCLTMPNSILIELGPGSNGESRAQADVTGATQRRRRAGATASPVLDHVSLLISRLLSIGGDFGGTGMVTPSESATSGTQPPSESLTNETEAPSEAATSGLAGGLDD